MKALTKVTLVAAAIVLSSVAASAGDRITHAAVGAVGGAVIAGPAGFVGGGVIGYVAGPEITCGLGIGRCYRHRRRHHRHYGHRAGRYGPDDVGRRPDHGNY